jgi:hypothetical protein
MAVIVAPLVCQIPSFAVQPKVTLRFRLLREGEVTTTVKFLRLYRGWEAVSKLDLVFWAESGSGEFTQSCSVDLATLIGQGDWLVVGVDNNAPPKIRAAFLSFTEGGTYTFNISNGEGGGASGDPATLPASVKVGGVPASREVVVIEKPSDGQWRLAGYGPTPGGAGSIDVRVTDGSLYAIGMDDWGAAFAADLVVAVDQTIRPSLFTGWLYRITEAGTLPATEPAWWPAEGDNASRLLGTARAIAVRYYQPLAHGPLPVELL